MTKMAQAAGRALVWLQPGTFRCSLTVASPSTMSGHKVAPAATWHSALPCFTRHPLVLCVLMGSLLAFPMGINFSSFPYFLWKHNFPFPSGFD